MSKRGILEIKLEGMESIAEGLAYCLSDDLAERGAFAFVKRRGIAIDLSQVTMPITLDHISTLIKNCLDDMGLSGKYVALLEDDKIILRGIDKGAVEEVARRVVRTRPDLHVCPHCGFATSYPELLREHVKVHYLL